MASELRVNSLTNRSGLGTVTYTNTGAIVTGIVTANSFSGDVIGNITGAITATTGSFSGLVDIDGHTELDNVNVSGISTLAGIDCNGTLEVSSTSNFDGDVQIADTILHLGDTNTKIRFPTADTITAETGGSERLRIDSNGRLIIGHTSSIGEARIFQIIGTTADTSSAQIIRQSANDSAPKLDLTKSRNATPGSNTIVNSGDCLGDIVFRGDDGTDLNSVGAQISAYVDGTPGANDMPGYLAFRTTADGSNSATERLRLTSSGQALIGAGAIATPKASVGGLDVASGLYSIIMGGEANTGDGTPRANSAQKEARLGIPHYTNAEEPFGLVYGVAISGENRLNLGGGSSIVNAATSIKFYTAANTTTTAGTERLQITSGGDVLIGRTSTNTSHALCVQADGGAEAIVICGRSADDIGELAWFENDSSTRLGEVQYRQDHVNFRHRVGDIRFCTAGASEKVRINTSGELLVNHDSSDGGGKIQAFADNQDGVDILSYSTTATHGGRLTFYRSKNATVGSNTEVADGDSLGRIDWRGYNDDGTAYNQGARIEAFVSGDVDSSTDMPTDLVFKTSANGSATPTEALRVHSNGDITVPSGSIKLSESGQGINFHAHGTGSGVTSNLLDDYEEGTFTPTIICSGGTGVAGSANAGYYTKVGRLVTCHGTLHWTSLSGSTSSYAKIQGLPYTTLNASGYRSGAVLGGQVIGVYWSGTDHAYINFGCDANMAAFYITAVAMNDHSGANYTHTPNVAGTGTLYGFTLTYYTA